MTLPPNDSHSASDIADIAERLLAEIDQHVLGQRSAAEQVLIGFMAGGHVLLRGIPGVGKTLLARTLSALLGLEMKRVQFTPDLMPADITGSNVFDPSDRSFRLMPGPIFTEILLADEINRTPPKTQSALLEAMQERQVTIDGETHVLPALFFVLATQNPVEFEGTYPLPEAQADRFLLEVEMELPSAEQEVELLRLGLERPLTRWDQALLPKPSVDIAQVELLRDASRSSFVRDELLVYLQAVAQSVRDEPVVDLGPSPRAVLALLEAARAACWLEARNFVTPDDLRGLVAPCWGHRVLLSPEAELEGMTPAAALRRAVEKVPVPTGSSEPPE